MGTLLALAKSYLTTWQVDPYLHDLPDGIINPLTDRALQPTHEDFRWLIDIRSGAISFSRVPPAVRMRLIAERWVVPATPTIDQRFLLKFVSLEANSRCNQGCHFCPVAVSPRHDVVMAVELYERIVRQLASYRDTIQGVFMNHYNEPTIDRFFLDRVRILAKHRLPIALLTNGTGLTPDRLDAIESLGGLRYLSVNLSTAEPEEYRIERQAGHLPVVLRNLEYAKDRRVAEEMVIVVLGDNSADHRSRFHRIADRFAGSRFTVTTAPIDSRAGLMQVGNQPPIARLGGCDQTGSRPLNHLHITAEAKAILCCQDYHSRYPIGDLVQNTVQEVLTAPAIVRYRRWAYGIDEAPADFICRQCRFALAR